MASLSQQVGGSNNLAFSNSYSYDGFDRLRAATSTTLFANETYSFDTLGRMTTRAIGGTNYPYSYGDSAHVDAPTSYHGNSYGYDAAGDQTSGAVGGLTETRSFEAENWLAQVVTTGGASSTTNFVYDGNGKRLLKSVTVSGTTTSTLYVGNLYEEQLTGSSHPYISYYLLGGKLVGLRRANQTTGNGQYRLVGDHLGSTTLLVDTSAPAVVVQRQYYKPYGESAYQYVALGALTSVNFTGQRLDTESGLLYYGGRYYDPVLSYFVSADPAAPNRILSQSRDRYSYTLNNPVRYTDPTGYVVSSGGNESGDIPAELLADLTKDLTGLEDQLSKSSLSAARQDLLGNPVRKAGGGYWDHFTKVNQAMRGLENYYYKLREDLAKYPEYEGLIKQQMNTVLEILARADLALDGQFRPTADQINERVDQIKDILGSGRNDPPPPGGASPPGAGAQSGEDKGSKINEYRGRFGPAQPAQAQQSNSGQQPVDGCDCQPANAPRAVCSTCTGYGYDPTMGGIPSPYSGPLPTGGSPVETVPGVLPVVPSAVP